MKIKFGKPKEWIPKLLIGIFGGKKPVEVIVDVVKTVDGEPLTHEKLQELIDGLIVALGQLEVEWGVILQRLDDLILQADASGIDPRIISRLNHAREIATDYPFLVSVRLRNLVGDMERGIL